MDVEVLQCLRVCAAGDAIGEFAVEQFLSAEGGCVGDAVDARENGIDLELIRVDLVGTETGGIGGLGDETLQADEKIRNLREATFRGGEDLVVALGVGDAGFGGGFFRLQADAGDETGRVVGGGVDAKAGGERSSVFCRLA